MTTAAAETGKLRETAAEAGKLSETAQAGRGIEKV